MPLSSLQSDVWNSSYDLSNKANQVFFPPYIIMQVIIMFLLCLFKTYVSFIFWYNNNFKSHVNFEGTEDGHEKDIFFFFLKKIDIHIYWNQMETDCSISTISLIVPGVSHLQVLSAIWLQASLAKLCAAPLHKRPT